MRKFLAYDKETNVLRLVFTDVYNGQHERSEWPVIGQDGRTLQGGLYQELDGEQVFSDYAGAPLYRRTPHGGQQYLQTGHSEHPTTKTPCPRATNRRKRCNLCKADASV